MYCLYVFSVIHNDTRKKHLFTNSLLDNEFSTFQTKKGSFYSESLKRRDFIWKLDIIPRRGASLRELTVLNEEVFYWKTLNMGIEQQVEG